MDEITLRYEFDSAPNGDATRVRRGRRREDGKRVVIKGTPGGYPSPSELAQIRHEYALLSGLADAPVAHALELVRVDNGIGLVLEDAGRKSFDRLLREEPFDLERWLHLAVGATAAVEAIHAGGVLHKDLKPQHFFCDDSQCVVLIDFSIATTLGREQQRPESLDSLEGTLAYISPEQTGRMNRAIDRRSDLYSLGVTLYEILTGALPFQATDPLELVHAHIARLPKAPCALRASIPAVLSDIVLLLLEKAAENRYQTAAGLKADLLRCLAQLRATGTVEPFSLRQDDQHGELCIPQKLYGREAAAELLLSQFRSASKGTPQLTLIGGSSGTGKSALVNELQKQLSRGGHLGAGKFDPLNRSVPYSALAQACSEFVRAQLGAPAEVLAQWTRNVKDALGVNGQLLIDIIPVLQLVIGRQPAVAQLGPNESQNRFERTFLRFFQACASQERLLVLFLDDLQWADMASLRLTRLMLCNPEQHYLFVIGNYRDNEIDAVHPLTQFFEDLTDSVPIQRIVLEPLSQAHVTELLADTLSKHAGELDSLARLVVRKTGGNPFFVAQFLDEIWKNELLRFDTQQRRWTWDLAAIEATGVTDNLVELIVQKLSRLEPGTQSILKHAACIGHRFNSAILASVTESNHASVARGLSEALEHGFLIPLDKDYRLLSNATSDDGAQLELQGDYHFTHDRVQEAAYSLIPESERVTVHLRFGRLLLAHCPEGPALEEALFEIVGHLNRGRDAISDPKERLRLCALDLRAATRAKSAAAHATALELAEAAMSLLEPNPWQVDYDQAYAAHLIQAECGYIKGDSSVALLAIDAVEKHARTRLERVPARNLKTLLLTHQNRLPEAIDTSIETARLLGLSIPDQTDKAAIGQAIGQNFGAYQGALAGRSVESLAELAPMTDPEKIALLGTLAQAIPATFQVNPDLMALIVLAGVQLQLTHGTAAVMGPYFYAQLGVVHALVTGDHETAYRFGQLALRLIERPGCEATRGGVHFLFGGLNAPWHRHLRESLDHLRLGFRAALDGGDPMHAGYCLSVGTAFRMYSGESLERIAHDLPGYVAALTPTKDVINLGMLRVSGQALDCLTGKTKVFGRFDDEALLEPAFLAAAPASVALEYLAYKGQLRFLAGFPAEALLAIEAIQPLPLVYYNVECKLFHALSLAELARAADPEIRAGLLTRFREDLEQHARWASVCPPNFAHHYSLLNAELAAVEGDAERAMTHYDRAIAEATAHGFVQYVALANELSGRFHDAAGRKKVARSYLIDARYHYQRWGATAKVAQLVRQFPDIDVAVLARDSVQTTRTRSAEGDGGLDLLSAMRATQAIGSELMLDRLIERLLNIVMENAGATRGILILSVGEELRVSAALSVEPSTVELELNEALAGNQRLATSVVQYAARSKESVVLDDVGQDRRFSSDTYLLAHRPKSLLCMPLLSQGELTAVLYLENETATGVFHDARLGRLQFLAAHAAVAIENAKLYGQVQAARASLKEANETLELRVRDRTAELSLRTADMRRVLDNVTQGLVTLDLAGNVLAERSLAAERWFGPFAAELTFAEQMSRFDAGFGEMFALTFEGVTDGFLPLDAALDQLPTQLTHNGREYRCSYSGIRSGEQSNGVLVVISDETDALLFAREEAAQKEQLAVFRKFAGDRSGLLGAFAEGQQMLGQMRAPDIAPELLLRLLHTLKGNAGVMELSVLAARCHAAEDALALGEGVAAALSGVHERWDALTRTLDMLLGHGAHDQLEVPRSELQRMLDDAEAGLPVAHLLEGLRRWRLEPVWRPLERLREHAVGLTERLGKGRVEVEIAHGGLISDPEQTRPLWSALVHVIRNAADHGFESAQERLALGKPVANRLRLSAALEEGRMQVEISDDGRGVDWSRVRALAQERGLPHATRDDLVAALMAPQLSTRSEVTTTSGRGLGLAALGGVLQDFGGSLAVRSETGQGCCWVISIPSAGIGAQAPQPENSRPARASAWPKSPAASA